MYIRIKNQFSEFLRTAIPERIETIKVYTYVYSRINSYGNYKYNASGIDAAVSFIIFFLPRTSPDENSLERGVAYSGLAYENWKPTFVFFGRSRRRTGDNIMQPGRIYIGMMFSPIASRSPRGRMRLLNALRDHEKATVCSAILSSSPNLSAIL